MSVDSDDLGVFLGQALDSDRADLMLELAVGLCETYLSPLPDDDRAVDLVVLACAARGYVNPQQDASVTTGPFAAARAPSLYLTRQERATLRRRSTTGGAFSIDMLPSTAAQSLPWWDQGPGSVAIAES